MFEKLTERGVRAAEARASRRRDALAQAERAELPSGVAVEAAPEGLRLSGRGLASRSALDPALRWMMARLR